VGVQISPSAPRLYCGNREKTVKSIKSGSSSAVECFLAKEKVAGSNPVFRSTKFGQLRRCSQEVKAGVCKTPIRRFESARRLFDSPIIRPRWRNGRRGGLKIRFLQRSVGSSPSLGSNQSGKEVLQIKLT
jgi:hypothetical protein